MATSIALKLSYIILNFKTRVACDWLTSFNVSNRCIALNQKNMRYRTSGTCCYDPRCLLMVRYSLHLNIMYHCIRKKITINLKLSCDKTWKLKNKYSWAKNVFLGHTIFGKSLDFRYNNLRAIPNRYNIYHD